MNELNAAPRSVDIQRSYLKALADIVGTEFVQSSESARDAHSMATIPFTKRCAAVVYPESAVQVQRILKVAAEFGLEVWPFSRGNNWGYGTKNALRDDAIILILERMNRIVEVNETLAYAVVEPGVTQKQLNDHLKSRGIKLWADCTDSTPNGSVLGNAIERGYGYTPYGDHFGQLCGLEVVLPTGELIRTGGEHAHAKTWNTLKWGSGPYIEGLFSQSNLGIVVKAGIWLMPEPESFELFNFDVSNDAYLPSVIDRLRTLALEGVVHCHTHMVNSFQMLTLLGPYPYDMLKGQSHLSDEAMAQLRMKHRIPCWSLVGGVYGSKDSVRINRNKLRKSLSPYGSLEFFDQKKIAIAAKFVRFAEEAPPRTFSAKCAKLLKRLLSPKPLQLMKLLPNIFQILQGIPNESIIASAYMKSRRSPPKDRSLDPAQDGCGLMWLAPALPATGADAMQLLGIVKPIYHRHGFDMSACFTLMNPRTFFLLLGIFFDQQEPTEKSRALALYDELTQTVRTHGYRQYRSGVNYMDQFMTEAPTLGAFMTHLKSAVDPDNVLAPGRYINRNTETQWEPRK